MLFHITVRINGMTVNQYLEDDSDEGDIVFTKRHSTKRGRLQRLKKKARKGLDKAKAANAKLEELAALDTEDEEDGDGDDEEVIQVIQLNFPH